MRDVDLETLFVHETLTQLYRKSLIQDMWLQVSDMKVRTCMLLKSNGSCIFLPHNGNRYLNETEVGTFLELCSVILQCYFLA